MFGSDKKNSALHLVRIVLAVIMFAHAMARISHGIVDDFGVFLGSQGIPLGFFVAWGITVFELVGSVLLAVGFYTHIIALLFAVQLAVGIAMVHWKEGWFVVGAGRNGIEFSVLLITCFLATAMANFKK